MDLRDGRGRELEEVVIGLTEQEVTELLVAAAEIDDGTNDHSFMRDAKGSALALYSQTNDSPPLQRGTDWWVGPIILLAVILLIIGAFTVARGFVNLIF